MLRLPPIPTRAWAKNKSPKARPDGDCFCPHVAEISQFLLARRFELWVPQAQNLLPNLTSKLPHPPLAIRCELLALPKVVSLSQYCRGASQFHQQIQGVSLKFSETKFRIVHGCL